MIPGERGERGIMRKSTYDPALSGYYYDPALSGYYYNAIIPRSPGTAIFPRSLGIPMFPRRLGIPIIPRSPDTIGMHVSGARRRPLHGLRGAEKEVRGAAVATADVVGLSCQELQTARFGTRHDLESIVMGNQACRRRAPGTDQRWAGQ